MRQFKFRVYLRNYYMKYIQINWAIPASNNALNLATYFEILVFLQLRNPLCKNAICFQEGLKMHKSRNEKESRKRKSIDGVWKEFPASAYWKISILNLILLHFF